jgi:hypothetical protein
MTKAFEMKNLVMTAAVGALMLPSLSWSAADGRGHNGPDLAPTSIPVALDHGIRSGQVEEALRVCYAAGDTKTGVVSLLQRLAKELTGGKANNPDYAPDYAYSYYGFADEDSSRKEFSVTGWIDDSGPYASPWHYLKSDTPETVKFFPNLEHKTPAPMPRVRYQAVAQDTGYDEYGRLIQSERILRGVSIDIQPAVYGTSVKLINSQTGVKSAITINTVEYVECLKSELQKRAE